MAKYWRCITDDSETNFEILDVCLRILKVYEFEIEDVIAPEELNSKNLVPDALQTNEYWSLKAIKPINSYLIQLTDLEEDNIGVSKVEYNIVEAKDIVRKADVHFKKIDEYIKELFENNQTAQLYDLSYDILDIKDNIVSISTDNYFVKKEDLSKILDKYFAWNEEYSKTIVC